MIANDILRSVRYALDLGEKHVVRLAGLGGQTITRAQLSAYLLKEGEAGQQPCPDVILAAILNGLITDKRGSRGEPMVAESKLDNNLVLKKLRIAFSLRDHDIEALVTSAGSTLSRSELNAFFQKPGHKNYKVCGDQVLRQFLAGLARQYRGPGAAQKKEAARQPDNPVYRGGKRER